MVQRRSGTWGGRVRGRERWEKREKSRLDASCVVQVPPRSSQCQPIRVERAGGTPLAAAGRQLATTAGAPPQATDGRGTGLHPATASANHGLPPPARSSPAHRAPAFSDSSGGRQPLRRFPSLRRAVISANGRVFPTSPAATTAFPASHAHTLLAKRHSSPAALADQFPANLSPRLGDSVATARVRA